MKKFFKIFVYNLLLFTFFLFLLEFFVFFIQFYKDEMFFHRQYSDYLTDFKQQFINKYSIPNYDNLYFSIDEFRKPAIQHSVNDDKNKSVLLLGCSFTYGENLEDNETFSYILSQYTGRNVYNLGLIGGSLREMLYILKNDSILYTLVPKDEKFDYVIYTYIYDHVQRLFFNIRTHSPVFKENNHSLEYVDYNYIFQSSSLINYVREFLIYNNHYFMSEMSKLQYLYIIDLNREIKKKFNSSRLIIINYWDNNDLQIDWDRLRKEGIIVIDIEKYFDDLHSEEYSFPDTHPKPQAWEKIVPVIAPLLESQD